jgi:hypothetical protein
VPFAAATGTRPTALLPLLLLSMLPLLAATLLLLLLSVLLNSGS